MPSNLNPGRHPECKAQAQRRAGSRHTSVTDAEYFDRGFVPPIDSDEIKAVAAPTRPMLVLYSEVDLRP